MCWSSMLPGWTDRETLNVASWSTFCVIPSRANRMNDLSKTVRLMHALRQSGMEDWRFGVALNALRSATAKETTAMRGPIFARLGFKALLGFVRDMKAYEIALLEGKAITETGQKNLNQEAFVVVDGIAGAVLEAGKLRDRYAETPGEANNIVRSLSSLMSWSIPRGRRTHNPCTKIRMLRIGEGYALGRGNRSRSFARIPAPIFGGRLRWHLIAVNVSPTCLACYWSDIQDGLLFVVQNKTGKKPWIPMHNQLRAVLAEIPLAGVHVLTNSRGVPWTTDGFKSSWGDEMKREPFEDLREKQLVFHGLRKSAVVFLLEAGCTHAEVPGNHRPVTRHGGALCAAGKSKKLAAAAGFEVAGGGRGGTNAERERSEFVKHRGRICKTAQKFRFVPGASP